MFEMKKLDEIADVFTGVRLSRVQSNNTERMPVLKRTSQENSFKLDFEMEDISEDINPKFLSEKDDILILLSGTYNIIKMEKKGYVIPMYYAIVRVKYGYDANFIYHVLKNDVFPRELHKLMEGSKLRIIKTRDLKEMTLPIPDYPMQREYGDLLKYMDRRINLKKEAIQIEEEIQQSILDNLLKEGLHEG